MSTNIGYYRSLNPASEQVEQNYDLISDSELFKALDVAQETWNTSWRHTTPAHRAKVISRAASILREKKDEYAKLVTTEIGKLIGQSHYEVELSASILEYYASHAEAFLRPYQLEDVPGCTVTTESIGVLLAIEPWNFPYYQLARVAGPQLVAGNVVLAKHAPSVPGCAIAFAKLFEEAGAPKGVWTNIFCTNEQAALLIDDFRIRGVTLTGSERAGSSVAQRAGSRLKKSVLELGGSDPFIILPDADLEDAIGKAAAGRLANMGQACIGSKRIIVVGKKRGEAVLKGMVEIFGKLKSGDPMESETTLGPLVNESIMNGLLKQVEDAKQAGARIVTGGKRVDRTGFYMEPTIITDISRDNPLFQAEAFGPVASFYTVETEDQAIDLANATSFGLGASIISADVEHAKALAARLECGMVFINSGGFSTPQVPFGGVKNSGFGRELSELGINEFVNKKVVRVRV